LLLQPNCVWGLDQQHYNITAAVELQQYNAGSACKSSSYETGKYIKYTRQLLLKLVLHIWKKYNHQTLH